MDRRETERKLLGELSCPESDPSLSPGVLLSNEIERFVGQFKLIDPFNAERLKPAGYELTVGDEYAIGGTINRLYDEPGKNQVTIAPFQVLIIKTTERVNLPRFLIARWNIRVKWAYEGLLWVGGPQVDPGYQGHLFCPLYNLSNKEVTLRLGEPIALIDFVTTTPFTKDPSIEYKSIEYKRPHKRLLFEDYNTGLKSALYTEARERIQNVENRVNATETRLYTSITVVLTVIAILVATLSMVVVSYQKVAETFPWWFYLSIALSLVAIVVSIIAFSKSRLPKYVEPSDSTGERLKKVERRLNINTSALIIVAGVVFWMLTKIVW